MIKEEENIFWKDYVNFIGSKDGVLFLNSPPYQHELKSFAELINPKENQIWLDVGCGALTLAKLIEKLSKMRSEVWAGDIYLGAAEAELKKLKNSKINLKQVDLKDKLPFPDNFFDGITASKVLNYIIEFKGKTGKDALEGVFRELFRVLKPGGILVWSFLRGDMNRWKGAALYAGYLLNPVQWIKTRTFLPSFAVRMLKWAKPFEDKVKKGIYHSLSREECEEILTSVGFEDLEWKTTFAEQIYINKANKPKL